MLHEQVRLNHKGWQHLAEGFLTTKHGTGSTRCNWSKQKQTSALQKSTVAANKQLWKWYFYIRQRTVIWMGSGPRQYVARGYQTWQVHKMLRQAPNRPQEKQRPTRVKVELKLSASASTSQAPENLFRLKLCFSGAAPGSMTMKSCTYPILT